MSDFVIENGVLTKYTGPGGDVVIPEGVTSIGTKALGYCENLTSVIIPNSVTSIGNLAFFLCTKLIAVTIPDSVTTIGSHAFCRCNSLTCITIPDSVTTIGNNAFDGCKSLTCITIPDSVTTIDYSAFLYCSSLAAVAIGNSVVSIGNNAFSHCESLKKLTLAVSAGAFVTKHFCYSDELRIDIPDISALPAKFRICAALCFAEDGGNATDPRFESHGKYLKANAGKMVETAMKNHDLLALLCREGWIKAKDIEAYVDAARNTGDAEKIAMVLDYQNSKLTKKQKENVVKQKEKAENTVFDRSIARMNQVGIAGLNFVVTGAVETFANRNELKAFIESQGGKLLSSMSAKTDYLITNYAIDTEKKKKAESLGIDVITEAQFNAKVGRQFIIDQNGTLVKYIGPGGDVTIPDSVKSIGVSAFAEHKGLTAVTIPGSVSSIASAAFFNCKGLTSVVLLDGVSTIGRDAFFFYSSPFSIVIPSSVKYIDSGAFAKHGEPTIHGKAGSYAEAYAKRNNIPFVADLDV